MNQSNPFQISYYKVIATIHEEHKVYLVEHIQTHKIYVKKILDIFNVDIYDYLFTHPLTGIPKIINYCQIESQLVVIEEYFPGINLEQCIESHSLDVQKITFYMYSLCSIVHQFHSCSPAIVHRDIKPSNCIITPSNEVVLLDFNAAKQISDKKHDTVLLGTHGYAAPEQYGFMASTCQSDIYSLGITCKEMVESLGYPCSDFDSIIHTCTQMDPKDRYHTVLDLQDAILSLHKVDSLKSNNGLRRFSLPGFRTRTP